MFTPDESAIASDDKNPSLSFIKQEEESIQLIEKVDGTERVKINVFPNPTVDFINVNFKIRAEESKIRLEVLDLTGALVPVYMPEIGAGTDEFRMAINVAHLPQGQYYIRYVSDKVMETFKFSKM